MPLFPRTLVVWCVTLAAAVFMSSYHAAAQTATQVYSEGVDALRQGDVSQAKRKLALALEIDRNYRPATALLSRIAARERAGGDTAAPGLSTTSLSRMVVPVEFKDTTLTSALEFLRQRIDETSAGRLKLNFAVSLPPELANKRVTLKLERVPVTEVLRYLGELAGVSFEVQPYAIVVTPAATARTPAAAPPATEPAR